MFLRSEQDKFCFRVLVKQYLSKGEDLDLTFQKDNLYQPWIGPELSTLASASCREPIARGKCCLSRECQPIELLDF